MKTTTFYEIWDGNGWIGKFGNYHFDTKKEAVRVAKEFKENPRSHNENMTEDNVAHWKKRTYTIQKKTIITEDIASI